MENLQNLLWRLQDILKNAPSETECTDLENNMYSDMQNLIESINSLLEDRRI